jgi:hypothetical protein
MYRMSTPFVHIYLHILGIENSIMGSLLIVSEQLPRYVLHTGSTCTL